MKWNNHQGEKGCALTKEKRKKLANGQKLSDGCRVWGNLLNRGSIKGRRIGPGSRSSKCLKKKGQHVGKGEIRNNRKEGAKRGCGKKTKSEIMNLEKHKKGGGPRAALLGRKRTT